MANETLIDPEAIENLRALNPDDGDGFLRDIVSIFLEDTPARIAELKQAFAAGDANKFTRAAHSIKGSSSNLGAKMLRSISEKLEHQSRAGALPDLSSVISELDVAYAATKNALEEIVPPATA
jgi:HPt (histidine-containing phosphotransfer) domain-containing protein